MTIQPNLIAL